jgi:hypothetical protein
LSSELKKKKKSGLAFSVSMFAPSLAFVFEILLTSCVCDPYASHFISNTPAFSVVSSVSFKARSKLHCAKECKLSPDCHSFAWEPLNSNCHFKPKVADGNSTVSAANLRVYFDECE